MKRQRTQWFYTATQKINRRLKLIVFCITFTKSLQNILIGLGQQMQTITTPSQNLQPIHSQSQPALKAISPQHYQGCQYSSLPQMNIQQDERCNKCLNLHDCFCDYGIRAPENGKAQPNEVEGDIQMNHSAESKCLEQHSQQIQKQDLWQIIQINEGQSLLSEHQGNRQQAQFGQCQFYRAQQEIELASFTRFLDLFKNQDLGFLLKCKTKLGKQLSFILQSWQIFQFQLKQEVKDFIVIFMEKMQYLKDYNFLFHQIIKLAQKLQAKTRHVKYKYSQEVTEQKTDLLLKHYIAAEQNKERMVGSYQIMGQSGEHIELNEYIGQTFRYEENPYWQSIYLLIHWKIQEKLWYDKHQRKQKKISLIHKIEPANIGSLQQLKFFYEQSNIYNAFGTATMMSLCGKIKRQLTSQGNRQFLTQLAGLLNNEGGVMLWDCQKRYLRVEPIGEKLTQSQILNIQNHVKRLCNKITPKIVYGIHYTIEFVPVALKHQSKHCWNKGRFALKFKQGQYVTMLKVFTAGSCNLYHFIDENSYSEIYIKQNVYEKCSTLKKKTVQVMKERRAALENKGQFALQSEQQRLQCLATMKRKLMKLKMLKKQYLQAKHSQAIQVIQQMSKNQNWNQHTLKKMKNVYQSLIIAKQLRYYRKAEQNDKHITERDFYFPPLNEPTLKSFAYNSQILALKDKYTAVYEKKTQQGYVKQFYAEPHQDNQDAEEAIFTRTLNFAIKKLQLLSPLENKLLNLATSVEQTLENVQQLYLWSKSNLNSPEQTDIKQLKSDLKEQQIVLKLLHFLKLKISACGHQVGYLNSKYIEQSIQMQKNIVNSNNLINKKADIILQNSKAVKLYCQNFMQISTQRPQLNHFLNRINKNIQKISEKNIGCFSERMAQVQVRALIKCLHHFAYLKIQLFLQANYCKNHHQNTFKCAKVQIYQKFKALLQLSQEINHKIIQNQQKFNQKLWVNQMNQDIKKFQNCSNQLRQFTAESAQNQLSSNRLKINQAQKDQDPCLAPQNTQAFNQKLKILESIIKEMTISFENIKQMIDLGYNYIITTSKIMERYVPRIQLYQNELDLLDQYRLLVQQLWPQFCVLSPIYRQTAAPYIGNPLKSPFRLIPLNQPLENFQFTSILISNPINLPKIKQQLLKYGFECQLVRISDKYKSSIRSSVMVSGLFHSRPHGELQSLVKTHSAQFTFNKKSIQIIPLSDYIQLPRANSRNAMTQQDFDNLFEWMRYGYPREELRLLKCQNQNREFQFYMKTQSKMSTILMFLVLGQHGEKCLFKNPAESQVGDLSVVYSSTKRYFS